MAAHSNQVEELGNAAAWLEDRQRQVLPAFRLQQVTVHVLKDPVADPEGEYAEVHFTWQGDHYDFTVS